MRLLLLAILLATFAGCTTTEDPDPTPTSSTTTTTTTTEPPAPEPGRVVLDPETPVVGEPVGIGFAGDHGLDCDPSWTVKIYDVNGEDDAVTDSTYIVQQAAGEWPVSTGFQLRAGDYRAVISLSCSPAVDFDLYFEVFTEATGNDCFGQPGEDSDDDGFPDSCDPCPKDASTYGYGDDDYDGTCNGNDLCRNDPNDECVKG